VIAAFAVPCGLALAAWGVRAATTRPRPVSLAAAVLAAAGLAMALLGALRLAAPGR
jgi:hypothetical protein